MCQVTRRKNKHKVGNSYAIPIILGIPRMQKSRQIGLKLLKACSCKNTKDKKRNGKPMASPYIELLSI
jgi:hypothetical protein